jgi:5'-phosphate synthase pdxT subunit
MAKKVGVLALQGDFDAHRKAIERAGGHAVEVRTADEIKACDGLILPGGESTAMLKLLDIEQLTESLQQFAKTKPIFGTCAGAILLAHSVSNPKQISLDVMDIDVERNGYGRQIDSRIAKLETEAGPMEAVFIRAPIIRRTGPEVRVLATYEGNPVWVEQGRHMVTTFHPELSTGDEVHRRLLDKLA